MALVELLNALGVALKANASSSSTQQQLGGNLVIAALAIQLAIIVIFVVLAGTFHRRCTGAKIHLKTVTTPLITLYVSMGLILIRCIYRLVEHLGNTTVDLSDFEAQKRLSPILRYEFYFYIFEATLMLINSMLWNVWNPGRYLPRNYHVHLAEDGRTEVGGDDEDRDERPLLAKAGHILTFGMFFGKKMKDYRVYELNGRQPHSL